jgi:cobalt-zinc-cadmium efflux system membrane fusion protein
MAMDSQFGVSEIDEKTVASLPKEKAKEQRPSRLWPVLLSCLIGIVIGMALVFYAPWSSFGPKTASAPIAEPSSVSEAPPMLIRKGAEIFLPESSPYRERIKIQPVELRSFTPKIVLPASVEADPTKSVNVLPPVAGRVIELKVHLGDDVKQGQILAIIGSGDFAQAATDVDKAKSALELTRRAYDRAKALKQFGGGAEKDVEQAQSDFTQAQAELARAENRLTQFGGTDDGKGGRVLPIVSPTDGTITAISTAPGAFLNDSTVSIMTVTDLATVWVTANVPENDLAFVAKNQLVDITLPAYPGEVLHGKVAIVSQVLEPDTRRNKVRIVFDNASGRLKPNMFGNVTFYGPARQAIEVPTSALLMNNDATTVFVETKPWTFERRLVQPEADRDGIAPIAKGLSSGDKVIISGGVLLND